ncbi:internal scaffolding protein [Blackfly microvirus SF02]|uniref:Internal scaffolding protein n=1 Tax=Blackfly microvirus SF02 TaxID=2576452 RepID=A0A4P8PK48_9VIRU|nr:internal scaffolding protein [Blackfly microvirus SF02]
MAKNTFPQAVNDFVKNNAADTVFNTKGASLTRQEFADECDINTLMKRYETYGTSMHQLRPDAVAASGGMYVDFSEMPNNLIDYLAMVKDAETAFMSLPAPVRREFDNNAVAFVDFASDPRNIDQMRIWGLAAPAKAPVEPVQAPAPVSSSSPPSGDKPPGGASTHAPT